MLDYTDGWTWFLAGLTATLAVTLLFLASVGIAAWRERRHPRSV